MTPRAAVRLDAEMTTTIVVPVRLRMQSIRGERLHFWARMYFLCIGLDKLAKQLPRIGRAKNFQSQAYYLI
jgi:hypothetical protein